MLSPPLLSSRLPPLTPRPTFRISSQHVNAHQETPSSHYSTVFHWHAVPSSSPHHTRRLSCYCYGNSFFFLYFVIPILLHFFFSSLFILFSIWLSGLGRKQRSVWNFDGHLPIFPTGLMFFMHYINPAKRMHFQIGEMFVYYVRCPVGQSFSKKAWTSGSRRAPTNLSISFPPRKAITVGKAVT